MKLILIDELIIEDHTQSEFNITINGHNVHGRQIAKPLNFNFTFIEKIKLIFYVLRNKAICVQFFEDMCENEKEKYIKNKLSSK
ncbi:MAG: hypothetical protein PF487_01330 [Bacteroidales bacterium]|jgi:hypothetical protein|nr:hypothetical protein [Bacteroidales bacterium]